METVFVLFFVFIVLIFAFLFIVRTSTTRMGDKFDELVMLDQVEKTQVIDTLPEFSCSNDGVIVADCLDLQKIQSFIDLDLDYEHYNTIFGNIKLAVIHHAETDIVRYDIYDNSLVEYDSRTKIHYPVTIYDGSQDRYDFGMIEIDMYT